MITTILSILLSLGAALAVCAAGDGFDVTPIASVRATTEIHGVPPQGSAHVENKTLDGYAFDGTTATLVDTQIEVDDPPPSNAVTFTGSVAPIPPNGQHISMSFYGPNAADGDPGDDEPIFVDLYGTYTDSDNPAGPVTGPIDLFDVGGSLLWLGVDASELTVDASSVRATLVETDGSQQSFALGEHPLRMETVTISGDPNERLRIGTLSSVFESGAPWVPDLMADVDEVHLVFDVFLAPPCDADLDGSGDVGFQDLLALLNAWGPCTGCDADLDGSGDVGFQDLLALLFTWGPCAEKA